MREVGLEEARRIAVHAQVLDGTATDVLSTVRQLGFLQLDPISVVAPPQHLVLWSRLGHRYDPAELDRLLWDERKLIEWDAYLYPIEDLPILKARMRRKDGPWDARNIAYLKDNAAYRRYILRELERRGPLLSREIEDHKPSGREAHRWWGARKMGLMLEVMSARGQVAVVGRRGKQRVWDLADRWFPECETLTWAEAERRRKELRFRSQGVRFEKGKWIAHPDADAGPVPAARTTFLSPFDQLIHDRNRAHKLWDFFYRLEMYVPAAKREYGYYVLPLLVGDRIVGRAEPRYDRKTGELELLGAWGDTARLDEAMAGLRDYLDARAAASTART